MKKNITVYPFASIKEALKKLDKTAEKTLFVVDSNNRLLGSLTDGDIRRHIIKTGEISGKVEDIYNKNPIFINQKYLSKENLKEIFINNKIEVLPVVDDNNKLLDFIVWTQVFSKNEKDQIKEYKKIDIPVVIMAGGKGTRLEPFTNVLPKPLIPVGEKTILEHIMDSFKTFGIKKFYLTLNYKGEMIEAYFKGIKKDYEVEFVWENEFLGTAGSLKLLPKELGDDFFVSNCDVVLKANFSNVYEFHVNNSAVFTSITSLQNYRIPYGVVEIKEDGVIKKIEEKPEYVFQINTGVYLINKIALDLIPKDKYFDMPELIKKLFNGNKKVIAYPINESDYIDIGQWEEYKKNWLKLNVF